MNGALQSAGGAGLAALIGGKAAAARSRATDATVPAFHLDVAEHAHAPRPSPRPSPAHEAAADAAVEQRTATPLATRSARLDRVNTDDAAESRSGDASARANQQAREARNDGPDRARLSRRHDRPASAADSDRSAEPADAEVGSEAVDAASDDNASSASSASTDVATASSPEDATAASTTAAQDAAAPASTAASASPTVAAAPALQDDSSVTTVSVNAAGDAGQQAAWQRLQALLGGDTQQAVAAALADGSLRIEFTVAMAQAGKSSAAQTAVPADSGLPGSASASPLLMLSAASPTAASSQGGSLLASVAALLHEQLAAHDKADGQGTAVDALAGGSGLSLLTTPVSATAAASVSTSSAPADASGRLMLMQDGWSTELVERVQAQARELRQEARIELHPQELGAMLIRIHFNDGVPQVQFAAENPQARAALQAALPQLQQMFASAGLAAPQVQVGEKLGPRGTVTANAVESATDAPRRRSRGRNSDLDDFA